MKQFLAFLVISALVATACSAYLIPEEAHVTFEEALESETKRIAEEAIQTGLILREVAQKLSQEVHETEEYFVRALWEKTRDAVKDAGKRIGNAASDAVSDLKSTMQNVAHTAKEKAKETALEIMAKIFSKFMSSYAADDFGTKTDSVHALCEKIAEAGERLVQEGTRLSSK